MGTKCWTLPFKDLSQLMDFNLFSEKLLNGSCYLLCTGVTEIFIKGKGCFVLAAY